VSPFALEWKKSLVRRGEHMRTWMADDARDTRADEGARTGGEGTQEGAAGDAKVPRDGSTYAHAKRLQLEAKDLPAAEAAFHQVYAVPPPTHTLDWMPSDAGLTLRPCAAGADGLGA